jgi:aminotransferase in exopolysaccharide biosynthesis
MSSLVDELLFATRRVTGPGVHALHEPLFGTLELELVQETIASTMVSSVGPQISQFEDQLKSFTGAEYVVATVNGTAALQMALISSGINRGDEVLIPSLTFAATASAVVQAGGVPVFIDSNVDRIGIDVEVLESWLRSSTKLTSEGTFNLLTGRKIHSILPVHIFGHPTDLEAIEKLTREFNIVLVEDAAESLGSYFKDKHTGTFGKVGILSFNGNKTITTGGGGALLTNDSGIAERARHLTTTAKIPHNWEYIHDQIGYNFRLPNLNAALGVAQMQNLIEIIELQRALFNVYSTALDGVSGIQLLCEPKDSRSNYWLQAVVLDSNKSHLRDEILETLNENGLKVRPAWRPLHLLQPYSNYQQSSMSGTEEIYQRVINLPSSPKFGRVALEG